MFNKMIAIGLVFVGSMLSAEKLPGHKEIDVNKYVLEAVLAGHTFLNDEFCADGRLHVDGREKQQGIKRGSESSNDSNDSVKTPRHNKKKR